MSDQKTKSVGEQQRQVVGDALHHQAAAYRALLAAAELELSSTRDMLAATAAKLAFAHSVLEQLSGSGLIEEDRKAVLAEYWRRVTVRP
jgi:hypothetical protein